MGTIQERLDRHTRLPCAGGQVHHAAPVQFEDPVHSIGDLPLELVQLPCDDGTEYQFRVSPFAPTAPCEGFAEAEVPDESDGAGASRPLTRRAEAGGEEVTHLLQCGGPVQGQERVRRGGVAGGGPWDQFASGRGEAVGLQQERQTRPIVRRVANRSDELAQPLRQRVGDEIVSVGGVEVRSELERCPAATPTRGPHPVV